MRLKMVTAFAAVLLAAFFLVNHVETRRQAQWAAQMEQEARPLEKEKRDLEQQLTRLNREMENQQVGPATLELLFESASAQVYEEIAPLMLERAMTGIIALRMDQMPGQEGAMSREEFARLLDRGWSWCLTYDEESFASDGTTPEQKISRWLDKWTLLLREQGLPMASTVYAAEGSYGSARDKSLEQAGFSMVIHHGEEDSPIVSSISEELSGQKLWKTGCCGWNSSICRTYLDEAIAHGGNLVFVIGDSGSGKRFERDSFLSMLKTLDQYVGQSVLMIMGPEEALAGQQQFQQEKILRMEENRTREEQAAVLESEIEELEARLEKIYEDYAEKVTGKSGRTTDRKD